MVVESMMLKSICNEFFSSATVEYMRCGNYDLY